MPKGVDVPPSTDPFLIRQEVLDSTVYEYYTDQRGRDQRLENLRGLGRNPIPFYSYTNKWGDKHTWALSWTEPRGGENAVRTSS